MHHEKFVIVVLCVLQQQAASWSWSWATASAFNVNVPLPGLAKLPTRVGVASCRFSSSRIATTTTTPISRLFAKNNKSGDDDDDDLKILEMDMLEDEDNDDEDEDDDNDVDDKDEEESTSSSSKTPDGMEKAWRYAKKPLLRIGSKGATLSHGNSLKQLLEQHTVVKVKVNTRRFNDSLDEAFEVLKELAQENGAPAGIELLQKRDGEKIILFGWPGTRQRILDESFPVAEVPYEPKERKDGKKVRTVDKD
jgi:RNA-binding protein YhbY